MQQKALSIFIIVLLFLPSLSWAVDYKDWLPYVPAKLDGLQKTPNGGGSNINMSGMVMSNYEAGYGIESTDIKLNITYDKSGASVEPYSGAVSLNLESPGFINKKVVIQGFDCVYQNTDNPSTASIAVILKNNTVLSVIFSDNSKSEQHYIDVVNTINLKKINGTL